MSASAVLPTLELTDLDRASGGYDWMEVGGAALRGASTGAALGTATGLAYGTFVGAPHIGFVAGGVGGAIGGAVTGTLENLLQQTGRPRAASATPATKGASVYPAP